MLLRTIARLWRTLHWLRPIQFYGRAWFRLHLPRPDLSHAPPLRERRGSWSRPAVREASLIGPTEWLLLNVPGELTEVGWDGPLRGKLWRYNQHYFDDLNARNSSERVEWHLALLRAWVSSNAPGVGVGWEPYPTSLRIVNWVKWALRGNELPSMCVQSIAIQARWLRKRLETHLLGNHLIANAKALTFAGLYFVGDEADAWLAKGLALLDREILEQILPDGGHFERSPMYHLIVLEDLLDLVNVRRAYALPVPEMWRDRVQRMLIWSRVMRHPDNEIPFFNDAAFRVAPAPKSIDDYALRLGCGQETPKSNVTTYLQSSGYARLENDLAVLLLDLAPVGPDYLPAHAHADTLSFELSIASHRVVVNGGTSVYDNCTERHRQRSTLAHAALVVDSENSSDVWGSFRVARRARVINARTWKAANTLCAEGAHDGFCRLKGAPVHHRRWKLTSTELVVTDKLVGHGRHRVEIVFPLAPTFVPHRSEGGQVLVEGVGISVTLNVDSIADVCLESTTWHPQFGVAESSWRVRVVLVGNLPIKHVTTLRWSVA